MLNSTTQTVALVTRLSEIPLPIVPRDLADTNAFQPSTDPHVCIGGACCGAGVIPWLPVMSEAISLKLLPAIADPAIEDVTPLSSNTPNFLTQLHVVDLALNFFEAIQRMSQRLRHSVFQFGVILELSWTDQVRTRKTDSIVAVGHTNPLTSAMASWRWYSQSVLCPRLMARVLLERKRPSFR